MSGIAPLVPAEVDLQDFAYMPLDVRRLRDSDMSALESPECCWAGLLLWAASWHQIPAASVPDDDRILAQLAGYGRVVKEWQRVKEGALRNFVLCDDGRFYHPVVAEKALEAWHSKLEHQHRKLCDRIRKENKARESAGHPALQIPSFDDWNSTRVPGESLSASVGMITASSGSAHVSAGIPPENALKGEGEGEVRERDLEKKEEGRDPKTKGVGTRGSRLPADWSPSDDLRAWAAAEHPDVDVERAHAEFVDYWIGVSGSKGCKLDWDATFRNAIRSDRAPRRKAGRTNGAHAAWWLDDASMARQGDEYGVNARPGESRDQFAGRIREAMRNA